MRKYLTYLILSALLFAIYGCQKEKGGEEAFSTETIQFAECEVTKAILDAGGINKTGTKVKVYDFLTGFAGSINGTTVTTSDRVKYIDDVISFLPNYWPFDTMAHEYRWTKSGTHRFFGWLHKDQSYGVNDAGMTTQEFFQHANDYNWLNESTLVMTTPTYAFTKNSPQYDFLFSKQAVVRDAASGDYSDVVLPMKHMFTAISLTLENLSTETNIQITDLNTLYNGQDRFLHSGYATVDFSANGELTPTYVLTGDENRPFFDASAMSGKTIRAKGNRDSGDKYDLLAGTDLTSSGTESYYLTWPLTQDQISHYSTNVFGEEYYEEEDKILALTYQIVNNGGTPVGPPETVRLSFPKNPWRAGTKMHMNIEFTDKAISISAVTLPWDFNEHQLSFNGESLIVPDGGKLAIDGMEGLGDNAKVRLTTETPEITCKLYISSLKGATLVISKVGADPSYFTLDPSSLTITGQQLSFKVKPSSLNTGGIERTCQLSFTVQLPDGREIDGDSEILGNDHNYTFSRR